MICIGWYLSLPKRNGTKMSKIEFAQYALTNSKKKMSNALTRRAVVKAMNDVTYWEKALNKLTMQNAGN